MSEAQPLYPLLLDSTLHVKVWGGRRLDEIMGKDLPTDEPYGESWELHDTSTVANGPLAGKTVADLLATYGTALAGEGNDPAEGLPLLAKLLDASDWLSIQVHPNDAQAEALEGQPRGKTEAWIILATAPDAKLVIGVEPGTSRETMAQSIRDNNLEDYIVVADVKPGDVLFIPAGTVHAIGPGIVLYEIQQSSNTTYRLYDWGRMGLDGNPRELHIDKGVQVSNVDSLPQVTHPGTPDDPVVTLVESEYFTTKQYRLADDVSDRPAPQFDTAGRFHALTCVDGEAAVHYVGGEPVAFQKGQTVLVPASLGAYTLHGAGTVLHSQQSGA